MSRAPLFAGGASVVAVLASAMLHKDPVLVWNTTASAPTGLYRATPEANPRVGDLVFVRPPAPLAARLAADGFLPQGALLLKRIAAIAPSIVCRAGDVVMIDGRAAADALARDRLGRPLPVWSGCRRLTIGEVFLLNTEPRSLDSRYFGPLPSALIVSAATPLRLFAGAADAR